MKNDNTGNYYDDNYIPSQINETITFEAAAGSLYLIARSFEYLTDGKDNEELLEKFGEMTAKDYFMFKESLKFCVYILKKVEKSTKVFELPENHII